MIYTNELANIYKVALSAYRADTDLSTNLNNQTKLVKALKAGGFEILDEMTGCFKEDGQADYSIEKSVLVLCYNTDEVELLARLASETFNQDCVMMVNAQTHATKFVSCNNGQAHYGDPAGVFQLVTEETAKSLGGYSVDSKGNYWSVI